MKTGTFSIVGADPEAGEVGVTVQSKVLRCRRGRAVGAGRSWRFVDAGAGVAVYGRRLLEQLEASAEPDAAIATVLRDDDERKTRQLGVVTADGRAAAFTGERCPTWAGHVASNPQH